MSADILGLLFKFFFEHRKVPRELVGLAAAVVAVINPQLGIGNRAFIGSIPVFMGAADTGPGLIETKKTGIDVVECPCLLCKAVAGSLEVRLFVKRGFDHELHIGINGQSIGFREVPLELFAQGFGIEERLSSALSKIDPGVFIGLGWNGKGWIEVLEDLNGIVRGPCIGYANGIGNAEG